MPRRNRSSRRSPPATLRELEVRAEALAGRSVGEVAIALATPLPRESRRAKGFVGSLVEAALGADPCAGAGPDFPSLGVELKTIPIGVRGGPVESTFCCSIDMARADIEEWGSSRLALRLACVLWVPVDAARVAPLAERRIHAPRLWAPSDAEEELLRGDWEDLMGAIGAGRPPTAHDGRVLQVRPKAANSGARALCADVDGPRRALPLGFYLRTEFTAAILAGAVAPLPTSGHRLCRHTPS